MSCSCDTFVFTRITLPHKAIKSRITKVAQRLMEDLQRSERRQNTNAGERISRDVFATRFVANVVSHVTQLKSPTDNLGVFYFSSITLIEHERYSFLARDQSKTSSLKK